MDRFEFQVGRKAIEGGDSDDTIWSQNKKKRPYFRKKSNFNH